MKTIKILTACALLTGASSIVNADSANVIVTADVTAVCQVTSKTNMEFGNLDPSDPVDRHASAEVVYWCTKGVISDVGNPGAGSELHGQFYDGTNELMQDENDATKTLRYSFTHDAADVLADGPSAPITITINGTVAGVDYENAIVGNYYDVITVNINPAL